jgi:hypothetical protein
MILLWPIRIGFCPTSGGGPHRQDYSFNVAEKIAQQSDAVRDGHTRLKGHTMKQQRQRLRLFVCMKTRTDGRDSCAYQGASIILDELQRQISLRGEQCSHIDVRPSGCLDRCEDGPVVMAFYGQLADEANPSRELVKASLNDAAYTFIAVSARDVSTILDTVSSSIENGGGAWDLVGPSHETDSFFIRKRNK